MRLVADRFVEDDEGRVMDLATRQAVLLKRGTAGGDSEHVRWTLRADFWRRLQHRAIAPLIDFGPFGADARFEAWQCGPPWSGGVEDARRVCDRATAFVQAAGLRVGRESIGGVHHGPARALVVPDDCTGYPDGSVGPAPAALPLGMCGLRLVSRAAQTALGELFERESGCRPRLVVIWGPPGAGKRMLVRELARTARVNGYIPIQSTLLGWRHADLWQGRSLLVIGVGSSELCLLAALEQTLRSPRPHVFVLLRDVEHPTLESIGLERLDPAALVSAVVPRIEDPPGLRRIERAAERANGLPGRFAQLLWGSAWGDSARGVLVDRGLNVAEQRAVYGDGDGAGAVVEDRPPSRAPRTWPAPGELASLRRRMTVATDLIERGRHAPGIRQLRQVVGGLARRGDWSAAVDGAMALASGLLRRGQPRDALSALADAREYGRGIDRAMLAVDAGILAGDAWIDLGRLDEAETVLAATVATARGLGDSTRTAAASIVLARCLYWRGDYAEAQAELMASPHGSELRLASRRDLLAARIALGQGHVDRALTHISAVQARARDVNDPHTLAAATYCAALVRCRIGDLEAAQRDIAASISTSRLAHDVMRAMRARILAIEVERRRGHAGGAVAQLERLKRATSTLPVIVRARSDLLGVLLTETDHTMKIVSRYCRASGLGALALYAGDSAGPDADGAFDSLAAEVVSIVRACQSADEEAVVLKDVCVRVRRQIHAVAVAIVSGPTRGHAPFACDGPRIEPGIAERAVVSGITIAPHRLENRIEAAVPLQYGGAAIGAMCARWTVGTTHDLRRAAAVLEMAAAAVAPIVAAMSARMSANSTTGWDLLGVTTVMADLRASVERAALAPFPVLVTGESGSGKELVARAIHRHSARRDRSFCTLNSAAMPDDLIEAELFGHARGAFTGAVAERIGVFEEAHGGTLFLDEIGELSARAQAKLLRALQEGEVRRVGENLPRHIDVRIIAATNRDLRADADAGRFRTDLLYRLDVIRIHVPPLRERREDIAVIAEHVWRDASGRVGSRATLGAATHAALARYDWPGNVRELQNVLAALAVRSPRRGVVMPSALPPQFLVGDRRDAWHLIDARRTFDEQFIRAALVRCGGHRGRAADELGLTRQGLTKLMARLSIDVDEPPSIEP